MNFFQHQNSILFTTRFTTCDFGATIRVLCIIDISGKSEMPGVYQFNGIEVNQIVFRNNEIPRRETIQKMFFTK